MDSPAARRTRRVGLALLVLASFLPYHGCIAHPQEFAPLPTFNSSGYQADSEPYTPAGRIELILRVDLAGQEEGEAVRGLLLGTSGVSNDYGYLPFFALIPWLAALGLLRWKGDRVRRGIGWTAWTASALFPPAIVWAMRKEHIGFGSGTVEASQAWAAGILAGAALLCRPPGRRAVEDVEATLSSHAVLGLGAALLRPLLDCVKWLLLEGYPVGAVMAAEFTNYRAGFFVALVGLSLVAAPLYLPEESLLPARPFIPGRKRAPPAPP